jgi:hypothetical protein
MRSLVALIELARLAWKTRFRLRGAYWQWRDETAFGTDPARVPTARARREAIIEYAHWVRSMRALRRR